MVVKGNSTGRWKPTLLLVSLGLVYSGIAVFHATNLEKGLMGIAVGSLPPFVMGLTVSGMAYHFYRGDLEEGRLWRIAGWAALGAVLIGLGSFLSLAYQRLLGFETFLELQLVSNTLTGGTLVGLLVGYYDVKQKKRNDQLRQLIILNRVVRHEIRNDMNLVYAWSLELKEEVEGEVSNQLQKIVNTSYHVNELTQNTKELIEIIEEGEETEVKPVDLSAFFENMVRKTANRFEAADFTMEGSVPEFEVRGDELLQTIFQNLLNNAVIHNDKERPEVEVYFEEKEGSVTVSIADNGPGVPDSQKEEIFGKGEMGLESEGTGIGLYLVNTLVEGYGGEVWVEDNEPEGSVFRVELQKA